MRIDTCATSARMHIAARPMQGLVAWPKRRALGPDRLLGTAVRPDLPWRTPSRSAALEAIESRDELLGPALAEALP